MLELSNNLVLQFSSFDNLRLSKITAPLVSLLKSKGLCITDDKKTKKIAS